MWPKEVTHSFLCMTHIIHNNSRDVTHSDPIYMTHHYDSNTWLDTTQYDSLSSYIYGSTIGETALSSSSLWIQVDLKPQTQTEQWVTETLNRMLGLMQKPLGLKFRSQLNILSRSNSWNGTVVTVKTLPEIPEIPEKPNIRNDTTACWWHNWQLTLDGGVYSLMVALRSRLVAYIEWELIIPMMSPYAS